MKSVVDNRRITEILHFTTNEGLVGILDSKSLKSRARLDDEKRLEFILKKNTPKVLDHAWVDYVNFSISRINSSLYNISSSCWHRDANWRILAFDPSIIMHEGVFFVTTNNAYPSAIRGTGKDGLDRLFGSCIVGRYRSIIHRDEATPLNHTTDFQAEVLYPEEVSTNYLNKIYVASAEEADDVSGLISALSYKPGLFMRPARKRR